MSSEDDSLDIEVPISYEMPDEGLSDYTVTLTDAEETPSGSVVPEPPAYKPFPFALRPAPDEKIHIYFGVLVHQINRMVFNTDGLVSQTGVNNPQTIVPSNLSSAENRYKFYTLNWRGDVYLYWKTDSAGNVTECDIRGPEAPTQQSLPNEGGEGEFN